MISVESAVSFYGICKERKSALRADLQESKFGRYLPGADRSCRPADVPEKDSEQVKADLQNMESVVWKKLVVLRKTRLTRKNTGIKRNRKRRRKQERKQY